MFWHVFPGIKCITDVQKLNTWIRRIIFLTFTFEFEAKKCLETVLHLFKIYQYLQKILRMTRHFKPLISGKIIFWTIQISFKTFPDVCLDFCLIRWFTSLRDIFFGENITSWALSRLHMHLFFKTRSFKKAGSVW